MKSYFTDEEIQAEGVLFVLWCLGLNPEPHAHEANALTLSYSPTLFTSNFEIGLTKLLRPASNLFHYFSWGGVNKRGCQQQAKEVTPPESRSYSEGVTPFSTVVSSQGPVQVGSDSLIASCSRRFSYSLVCSSISAHLQLEQKCTQLVEEGVVKMAGEMVP